MAETCPYCNKETKALKNHVRLATGNGHGPNGEYPPDFDSGSTSSTSGSTQQSKDGVNSVNNQATPGSTQQSKDGVNSVDKQPTTSSSVEPVEFPTAEGHENTGRSSNSSPDTCPRCGDEMIDAEVLFNDLEDLYRDPPNQQTAALVQQFFKLNHGEMVEEACRDVWECGYYIDEDYTGKEFQLNA
jgi:hypothetical protein